ncbi:MAG: cytochrome c maturation protein CcmE [Anaerolineales bacterium]|nr:cytochrome c maturation protein CcmE [Anaerolineales bacterium]
METSLDVPQNATGRMKFIVGGLLIIAAVVYLIVSATSATIEYFYTIDEIETKGASVVGQSIRVSGAVDGKTIEYDPETLTLKFTVVHVPGDLDEVEKNGGLAQVLHEAVIDPTRTRLEVVYVGVKPDLLRDEAQAIMTGKLGDDGVFYAEELLLKCPTRYEEYQPEAEG